MSHRESHTAIFDFCGARTQETKRPCTGFQAACAKVAFANSILRSLGSDGFALDKTPTCARIRAFCWRTHQNADHASARQAYFSYESLDPSVQQLVVALFQPPVRGPVHPPRLWWELFNAYGIAYGSGIPFTANPLSRLVGLIARALIGRLVLGPIREPVAASAAEPGAAVEHAAAPSAA